MRKRIGRSISKKEDEGYELVFDILLGIRNTVSRTEAKRIPDKALQSEFNTIVKERYPSHGNARPPARSFFSKKIFDFF